MNTYLISELIKGGFVVTCNGRRFLTCKEHDHATKAEAAECYRQYILDSSLSLMNESANTQHECTVCEKWTNLSVSISGGSYIFHLCEAHNNRENVERLFLIGEDFLILSSW